MSNSIDPSSMIREALTRAEKKAKSLGTVVGRVSRKAPSRLSGDGAVTIIEVDPVLYYTLGDYLGLGNYLVAVDIRTGKAVGLRVVSVQRSDMASIIDSLTPLALESDVDGLLTNAFIEASTLLDEDGSPFTVPLEPQSPVVIPDDPDLLAKVAGLPTEGVILGSLHTGSSPVAKGNVRMYLPRREFFKHMLVIGTTGSGKTTFLKNLLYSINSGWPEARLVVIDAAGDYTQLVLPPPNTPEESSVFFGNREEYLKNFPRWVTVLLPVRRGDKNLVSFAVKYVMDRLGRIAVAFHSKELKVQVAAPGRNFGNVNSVVISCIVGEHRFAVEVVPVSPSYVQLKDHLEIFPLFSRQAKIYLKNVINFLEDVENGITNFTHLHVALQDKFSKIKETLKLHKTTLESIERAINFIASAEEVDTVIDRKFIGMPSVEDIMRNYSGPVILDLDYAAMRGAHFIILNMIAYEFMRELYLWKKAGSGLTVPTIVVLDEAHRFFPSEGTSREEVELLADFISRVARLGRSRGLGLIFSTHSPKDVHKIVLQLTNTKVVFRSEKEFLEMLDVPKEYIRLMELAPDRVGMIRTSVIRAGHAIFKTSEALLGHYDLGRLAG